MLSSLSLPDPTLSPHNQLSHGSLINSPSSDKEYIFKQSLVSVSLGVLFKIPCLQAAQTHKHTHKLQSEAAVLHLISYTLSPSS